jgi:hypothetical protein
MPNIRQPNTTPVVSSVPEPVHVACVPLRSKPLDNTHIQSDAANVDLRSLVAKASRFLINAVRLLFAGDLAWADQRAAR